MNLVSVIAGAPDRPIEATGGTTTDITVSGKLWRVHTFTTNGTFAVSDYGSIGNGVEYLIVAGGGGGGGSSRSGSTWRPGGGGGAGGMLTNVNGSLLSVFQQSYSVVVGGEGAAGNNAVLGVSLATVGTNGGNSSVFGLTAIGGGGGGAIGAAFGVSGGSGGGAGGAHNPAIGVNTAGEGTAGQGNRGGYDGNAGNSLINNGGGGAGGAGQDGTSPTRVAGAGLDNSITGATATYAAGGLVDTPAANTGSGGATRRTSSSTEFSGTAGASGIVVIRYPLERL